MTEAFYIMSWNVCKMPECESYTARPDGDYCESCRRANAKQETESKKQLEKRKSLLQKAQSRNLEPRKKINKVSDKQAERLAEYSAKRLVYLSTHKACEARVENVCDGKAIEIHHRAGRIGEMLTDVTYFLAVCRGCHDFIHQHPLDALKRNLSVSRLATHEPHKI